MFAIERKTGAGRTAKWDPVEGEYSTADLAKNIARMRFGRNNPSVRVVDRDAPGRLK